MPTKYPPCRYCGKQPSDWRHALDDGRGDHGYAAEQFPGDRAEPLWQHDHIATIPTSAIEQMVGRRLTVAEATRLRDRIGHLVADNLPAMLVTLNLKD